MAKCGAKTLDQAPKYLVKCILLPVKLRKYCLLCLPL